MLASCGGYSLGYIVEGDKYNSYIFTENYYTHWDSELKKAQEVSSIDITSKSITNFSEIIKIDPNAFDVQSLVEYGELYNLMKADSSFYYGVQSKLFDGKTECNGFYQKRRVQMNRDGFSVRFSKESDEVTAFATNFKATTNNQYDCYPVGQYVPSYANMSKLGKDFDLYVDVSNWKYYYKDEGEWKVTKEESGTVSVLNLGNENTKCFVLYGLADPASSLGEDNNVYINLVNRKYFAKISGAWVEKGLISSKALITNNTKVYTGYGIDGVRDAIDHDRALYHNSSFTMNVTIYTKEQSKIVGHKYYRDFTFDNRHTNDGSYYVFYGFEFRSDELSRMVGFSITLDNLQDELVEWNKGKSIDGVPVPEIDYSLFVYEVFLPHTYWH